MEESMAALMPACLHGGKPQHAAEMWNEPYLETCCRAALHRLFLAGASGRPGTHQDRPCLRRLAGMGLAGENDSGGFNLTPAGAARHAREILKRSA
jgi:hypothetical protein